FRWFPLWAFSSACVVMGFMNGVHVRNAPPSEGRAEEWQRFYAQVDWYAIALALFWAQLFLWGFLWLGREKSWYLRLLLAWALSSAAFLAAVVSCVTDAMFH